jgi:ribosomal protein S18 acetylase RimI-like enzyme
MSLQCARTADVAARLPAGDLRVDVQDRPSDAWFQTWWTVLGGDDPGADLAMVRRVEQPSGYAAVRDGGAVGRAVADADADWAGLFGMATLPDARGRGAGRAVLAALAGWAAGRRAAHLYLQVECGNTGARRLYERAGFTEKCRYHYRVRPTGSAKP